jgi:8-oxo-dGTP pyrophosphatase MutT (NUDIX family)
MVTMETLAEYEPSIQPTDLDLVWTDASTSGLDSQVAAVLERAVEGLADDGPSETAINLDAVRGRELVVSAVEFEWYLARQAILRTDRPFEAPDAVRERLRSAIRVLSAYNAVITDRHLLLGLRPEEYRDGYPVLSCPGSGYLTTEDAVPGVSRQLTADSVLREVTEEVGLDGSTSTVRCLGIFEERGADTDQNPGLFSTVTTTLTRRQVHARWRDAADTAEFLELLWVPIDGDAIPRIAEHARGRAPAPGRPPG